MYIIFIKGHKQGEMMKLTALITFVGIATGSELKGYGGVSLSFNNTDAGYAINVDGQKWFESPSGYSPGGWRLPLILNDKSITYDNGTDTHLGPFNSVAAQHLSKGDSWMLDATIKVYTEQSIISFTSCYPKGARNPQGTWSVNEVISAFPAFSVSDSDKNYLGWAGNQLANTSVSKWSDFFGDQEAGIPVLVHNNKLRSVVISPYDNFLTSVHASRNTSEGIKVFAAGIKGSIGELPTNFCHTTLMLFGNGVNNTMMAFGDQLLQLSGKKRVDAKKDFILSKLGYWTDHGGFYYRQTPGFRNAEDALLAVKADAINRGIPIHYFQWDDWWYSQYMGDSGGLVEWQPEPQIFPSGMTDWLGMPLSLYMAEYSKFNIYVNDYKFYFDNTNHSLPIDKNFYIDLFRNGTKIGMKMFEQDFLSAVNQYTNLTSNDTHTADDWLNAMGDAAKELDITLQYCMMHSIHTLKSSEIHQVTNGRASADAIGVPSRHLVLGMSGMLHYSMGIWPSADNVWTSAVEGNQTRAPPLYTTIIAVLVGGPYGPSDEVGLLNKSVIMQTCRDDGVLLRVDKPITMVESSFILGFKDADPPAVWSAYSEVSGNRWGYIVGLNLNRSYPLRSLDINELNRDGTYRVFDYLSVDGMRQTSLMDQNKPFMIPECPDPKTQPPQLGHGYHIAAPLLEGGWYLLGEVNKIVSASNIRFRSVDSNQTTLTIKVIGVPDELIKIGYVKPSSSSTSFFNCEIPSCSTNDCLLTVECSLLKCTCK